MPGPRRVTGRDVGFTVLGVVLLATALSLYLFWVTTYHRKPPANLAIVLGALAWIGFLLALKAPAAALEGRLGAGRRRPPEE